MMMMMMMMMMEMQHPHRCDDDDNDIVQGAYTLLHWAAANGRAALLPELVGRGLEVDVRTGFGDTPLMYACINGHESSALALIALGADLTARDNGVR